MLLELNRCDQALLSCKRAIEINPKFLQAYLDHGIDRLGLDRLDDALANFGQTIKIKPDDVKAIKSRGYALKELKRLNEVLISYDQTLEITSDYELLMENCLHIAAQICALSDFSNHLKYLCDALSCSRLVSLPFPLLALSDDRGAATFCGEGTRDGSDSSAGGLSGFNH